MGIRVGALVAPVGLGATIVAASANVFAQSGFGSPNDQFRYVYKNTVDNEFFSRAYCEDTQHNRGRFLEMLGLKGYTYGEVDAETFINMGETKQIFVEVIQ